MDKWWLCYGKNGSPKEAKEQTVIKRYELDQYG